MADTKSFRFLDLPKELRLMVYELIPIKNAHHPVKLRKKHDYDNHNLMLVRTTLPGVVILPTCRQIHHEAEHIIRRKLATVDKKSLRIISTDCTYGAPDIDVFGVLNRVVATKPNCGIISAMPIATQTYELQRTTAYTALEISLRSSLCSKRCYHSQLWLRQSCAMMPDQAIHFPPINMVIAFRRTDSNRPFPLHACKNQFESTARALYDHFPESMKIRRLLDVEIRPALLSVVPEFVAKQLNDTRSRFGHSEVRTGGNIEGRNGKGIGRRESGCEG
jgi:hypothetical protein